MPRSELVGGKAMTIPYVENHAVFATRVTDCFLRGHQVDVVSSSSLARTYMATTRYDLQLIDYDLDESKGSVLARALQSAGLNSRIIDVSAAEKGNETLLQAGVDAICGKMECDRIHALI